MGLSREGLTKVWVPGAESGEAVLEFCPQRGRGRVCGAGSLNSVRKNVLQEPNELVTSTHLETSVPRLSVLVVISSC